MSEAGQRLLSAAKEMAAFATRPSARDHSGTAKKKGAQAEALRAQKENRMLNTLSTTTNIKQGIGSTVTVFDDKELARQRREAQAAVEWFAKQMLRAEDEVFSEALGHHQALLLRMAIVRYAGMRHLP